MPTHQSRLMDSFLVYCALLCPAYQQEIKSIYTATTHSTMDACAMYELVNQRENLGSVSTGAGSAV